MTREDEADKLTFKEKVVVMLDLNLDDFFLSIFATQFGVSHNDVTYPRGLEEFGRGLPEDDIGMVDAKHRRIVSQAKDESAMDEPLFIDHHVLVGGELYGGCAFAQFERSPTEAGIGA